MTNTNPGQGLLDRLTRVLPQRALLMGDAIGPVYQEDRRGRFSAKPRFILRPGTTAEVSAALAACDAVGQRLVMQGGRTGLAGAHRIMEGEAVLSLERMTAIGEVEPESATLIAEAGVPLQAVQMAAARANHLFGVDIGSRGTATIGGAISTNAGGIRVLRYGMFRAQIAGLETVLADGSVLSSLRGLDKDNTGYDLNQLFIGAEGTLGVVTRARLRLHPAPVAEQIAVLSVPTIAAALALLRRLKQTSGGALSAFEIMLPDAYAGVIGFLGMPPPLPLGAAFYILAEIQASSGAEAAEQTFQAALMAAITEGEALDAIISQSQREFAALWAMRDAFADYTRTIDHVSSGDISVPLSAMAAFLPQSQAALRQIDPETAFIICGHLGDGNLHYVIQTQQGAAAMECLLHMVVAHGGSVSAEHGIGVDKKPWLRLSRSAAEIAAMQRLKAALDPRGILNRDRIFDHLGR
jgi:FAD/FMN-containing dehydrogenase